MNRRKAIIAVGAATTTLAGCLGTWDSETSGTGGNDAASPEEARADEGGDTDSDDGQTAETDAEPADTEPTDADDGESDESAESATAAEDVQAWRKPSGIVQVGSSEGSHRVVLGAESDVSLETTMEIRIQGGKAIYEDEISVSAEDSQTILFRAKNEYLIDFPETAYPSTEVSESNVDCNGSVQDVIFGEDGAVERTVWTTLAICDADPSWFK
ncbi:hypothetical protein OB905_09295 [Halobacteria archaeon AArc-dxtr1]|nr:hypothetical protein [Halobacteria archaeon AArc-dxtr1]